MALLIPPMLILAWIEHKKDDPTVAVVNDNGKQKCLPILPWWISCRFTKVASSDAAAAAMYVHCCLHAPFEHIASNFD
jgi:hypothetical protein